MYNINIYYKYITNIFILYKYKYYTHLIDKEI